MSIKYMYKYDTVIIVTYSITTCLTSFNLCNCNLSVFLNTHFNGKLFKLLFVQFIVVIVLLEFVY